MSIASKLRSPVKPIDESRAILCSTGNRFKVTKTEMTKKPQLNPRVTKSPATKKPDSNFSVSTDDSSFSSSSSERSSVNTTNSGKVTTPSKRNGVEKLNNVVASVAVVEDISPKIPGPVKRCHWITPNSDPIYVLFHDEEWGVPVRDDKKLFELLVFSQALAEFSWPSILRRRDDFRKLFEEFDPSAIAEFTEKRLMSLRVNGCLVLSEQKLRAIVENAKSVLKVKQEFGSFSNYCWRFVNHKPLRNGYRYGRQVPVKSPKAEYISKDMMQRGFRCVGPTVMYSFLQASGIVNDHLTACFRYQECNVETERETKSHETETKLDLHSPLLV
ncbi:putative DNA-3-methyladenine glycosylase I [Arabidopsis thaliana]|uniref:Methyladenine glycosylase n=1 Tax=Arabidopsis thaliana x Arabidopsis arenosa TaxID=1240361 RepID=A0A8T2GX81_9BRAS|nr:Methyladenine glycosylase [Arabidopsis thaliana x Arabidopsis arenosa]